MRHRFDDAVREAYRKAREVVDLLRPVVGEHGRRGDVPDMKSILRAVEEALPILDQRGSHGGLVPIPELRAEVLGKYPGLSRETFDQALLALERAFDVDLKVANDPRAVDEDEGIPVTGRGLVYFAVYR